MYELKFTEGIICANFQLWYLCVLFCISRELSLRFVDRNDTSLCTSLQHARVDSKVRKPSPAFHPVIPDSSMIEWKTFRHTLGILSSKSVLLLVNPSHFTRIISVNVFTCQIFPTEARPICGISNSHALWEKRIRTTLY